MRMRLPDLPHDAWHAAIHVETRSCGQPAVSHELLNRRQGAVVVKRVLPSVTQRMRVNVAQPFGGGNSMHDAGDAEHGEPFSLAVGRHAYQ